MNHVVVDKMLAEGIPIPGEVLNSLIFNCAKEASASVQEILKFIEKHSGKPDATTCMMLFNAFHFQKNTRELENVFSLMESINCFIPASFFERMISLYGEF